MSAHIRYSKRRNLWCACILTKTRSGQTHVTNLWTYRRELAVTYIEKRGLKFRQHEPLQRV